MSDDAQSQLWLLFCDAFQAISNDLEALLQIKVKMAPKPFADGQAAVIKTFRGPGVAATTVIEAGVPTGRPLRYTTRFVFKNADAMTMIGSVVLLPKEVLEERRKFPPNERELDEFREIANQICGSANRAFDQIGKHLRVSQSTDHLKVAWTKEIEKAIPTNTRIIILPVVLSLEGFPLSECVQIFPADCASQILKAADEIAPE